jgi:hypothetical protein
MFSKLLPMLAAAFGMGPTAMSDTTRARVIVTPDTYLTPGPARRVSLAKGRMGKNQRQIRKDRRRSWAAGNKHAFAR